jgi:hypothetical protein
MTALFPAKPKGMWRRTFERLRERAFEAEITADETFALRAKRLQRAIMAKMLSPGPRRLMTTKGLDPVNIGVPNVEYGCQGHDDPGAPCCHCLSISTASKMAAVMMATAKTIL